MVAVKSKKVTVCSSQKRVKIEKNANASVYIIFIVFRNAHQEPTVFGRTLVVCSTNDADWNWWNTSLAISRWVTQSNLYLVVTYLEATLFSRSFLRLFASIAALCFERWVSFFLLCICFVLFLFLFLWTGNYLTNELMAGLISLSHSCLLSWVN